MIIEQPHHRARVVKGWAFMDLDAETVAAIRRFLESGNTDDLPASWQRPDYSIYTTRA